MDVCSIPVWATMHPTCYQAWATLYSSPRCQDKSITPSHFDVGITWLSELSVVEIRIAPNISSLFILPSSGGCTAATMALWVDRAVHRVVDNSPKAASPVPELPDQLDTGHHRTSQDHRHTIDPTKHVKAPFNDHWPRDSWFWQYF